SQTPSVQRRRACLLRWMGRCLTPLRESDTKHSAAVGLLDPMGSPVSDTLTGVRHQAFSGGGLACSDGWARCLTPLRESDTKRSVAGRLLTPMGGPVSDSGGVRHPRTLAPLASDTTCIPVATKSCRAGARPR